MKNAVITRNGKNYWSEEWLSDIIVKGLDYAADSLADLCERKCNDPSVKLVSNAFQYLAEMFNQIEPEDFEDCCDFGSYIAWQTVNYFDDLEDLKYIA